VLKETGDLRELGLTATAEKRESITQGISVEPVFGTFKSKRTDTVMLHALAGFKVGEESGESVPGAVTKPAFVGRERIQRRKRREMRRVGHDWTESR
jgi:hypothetical protein